MTIKKKPKVKSVGTVDFNVNTESGKLAYNRALNASKRAGAKTDKAKDAATTEEFHGAGNRRVKEAKGGNGNGTGTGRTEAEKWAAAAEATGKLADVAGSRAKASKSSLDVTSTKVRSNNKSAYNYYPKKMSQQESTTPMVRFDSDYEKEKKRLGLS